jgi:hypothetical protein
MLGQAAPWPPCHALCPMANRCVLCPVAVLRGASCRGAYARALHERYGVERAHRCLRLAHADDAVCAVGRSDLCKAAMRTHPHVRTRLHACASAPPTRTVPRRRAARCRAACRCGGRNLARRPCTHSRRRTPSRTTEPGRADPARSQQCAAVATAVACNVLHRDANSAAKARLGTLSTHSGYSECSHGVLTVFTLRTQSAHMGYSECSH